MTDRAGRFRLFMATYVMYVGSLGVLLAWVGITNAYLAGDWRLVFDFNYFGEGPLELVVLTLLVSMLPFAWMAFHEILKTNNG
jgi:hypothetical protein